MAEAHAPVDLDQSRLGRRRLRIDADADAGGGPPQPRRVFHLISRGEQQQCLSVGRQRRGASAKALLDPSGQGPGDRAGESHRERGGAIPSVARPVPAGSRGLGDDSVAQPLIERPVDDGCDSSPAASRRALRRSARAGRLSSLTGSRAREQQRDRLGKQSPGDEAEHLRGGTIEPLCVLHEAHRGWSSAAVQQGQRRQADQETLGCSPEGCRTRRRAPALRHGQLVDPIEERDTHLVQPGERAAPSPTPCRARGRHGSRIETRSRVRSARSCPPLAHLVLRGRLRAPRAPHSKDLVERVTLADPADQHRPIVAHRHGVLRDSRPHAEWFSVAHFQPGLRHSHRPPGTSRRPAQRLSLPHGLTTLISLVTPLTP